MVIRFIFCLSFVLCSAELAAQAFSWQVQTRADMPEAVANNAVAGATVNGESYAYSFAGIDSNRNYTGIHLKAWRYRLGTDSWESIASLPDTLGKVAAAASTVDNKIYIIGGYHVFANGSELSSDRVHIYDPESNQYLPDGAAVPIAIDDQAQAVWRDSLIYVISGWSNTTNVPNVQIYDPSLDQWSVGTSVPDNGDFKVFGGSGVIIGDTIYYVGGARIGPDFPLENVFRIGIINPQQPTQITWSSFDHPLALTYRTAAFAHQGSVIWAGGAGVSYNYNGFGYNGSGPVVPYDRMVNYYVPSQSIFELSDTIPPIMDIRGVAQLNDDQFMILGGMAAGPNVSQQVLLLSSNNPSTHIRDEIEFPFTIRQEHKHLYIDVPLGNDYQIQILTLNGQIVRRKKATQGEQHIALAGFASGTYFLRIVDGGRMYSQIIVLP
ncbi:MAG: T9SS type A sorting domain-containing protein [Bacteroidia bacterium]